ncbi:MAG TPA: glutamate-cysteine ligase family protein [Rubrobacter sp.]|nr:glutamate-cysteine ligase family protein [Rubrobacter sp.]
MRGFLLPAKDARIFLGVEFTLEEGNAKRLSGSKVDGRDRLLDRSIGLEQEFFLVEESGEPSVRADEFLERCRERSEREGDDRAACLAPEWVKGVVEVNTPPVRSLADLEENYADNVRLAVGSAREIGLRLYPLGTYPLPLEPAVREEPDYQVQVLTVGPERFMDAGRCAGTHLHLGLPDGTVSAESGVSPGAPEEARRELLDLYNLATALDPALIFLTRSCPFYEGQATGLAPRTARYRGSDAFGWEGVYRDLPEVGALRPYARSPAHLVQQQFDRYRAWLAAMERAGVDLALFVESGGDLLRPAWNPVRLNRQGTLELRGMDSNLPQTTFAAVELVLFAAGRVVRENLRVTPDEGGDVFEVDGDRLLVPGFGRLGERLLHAAVAGGADDPTITAYLDSVLDFAAGDGPRLEKLRLRRQATGHYPTTEGKILAARGPGDERISGEEGLSLVLWACDELEGQISGPEPEDGTPGVP